MPPLSCPLCINSNTLALVDASRRKYWHCSYCDLIFVDPADLPTKQEEHDRYLLHDNGLQFTGYVQFLERAIHAALPHIQPRNRGLDFGCGPQPTLSKLMSLQGYIVDDYDPFFFPNGIKLKNYDFLFATESVEHFTYPGKTWDTLHQLIKPNGTIVIMTELWENIKDFSQWHYTRDITHVSFYHQNTLDFLTAKYSWQFIPSLDPRVFLWKKGSH